MTNTGRCLPRPLEESTRAVRKPWKSSKQAIISNVADVAEIVAAVAEIVAAVAEIVAAVAEICFIIQ